MEGTKLLDSMVEKRFKKAAQHVIVFPKIHGEAKLRSEPDAWRIANTYSTPTIFYRVRNGVALGVLMVHYHCWLWGARLRQVLCGWHE